MDVGDWLRSLGLAQYEAVFRESEIEADVLADLTEADLTQLGLPLGPRKRLLKAIASLRVEQTSGNPPPEKPFSTDAAERRQLTVMFSDLVNSTAMSARLDPEDMREVIRAYQDACSGAVARYDGFAAKFMGDGVLAYFGFPRAHEEDAERAVKAALDIIDVVTKLDTPAKETLNVRIGIATGIVVVGDLVGRGSAQEQAVVGETPNLAARLQMLAEPGSVIISEATRRLLGGAFELKALGHQTLKGFDALVPVWAVLREVENVSRFETSRSQTMTPFVGREHEVALLLERWRDANEGEGQVVLISGEAGIGKSRLSAALREKISSEPHVMMRYQCSPHHINDAFYPITNQIWHAATFVNGEPVAERLDKLEAMISRSGLDPKKVGPLIASLLAIPFTNRYPHIDMAPSEQKERTVKALIGLFEGLTKDARVLALLEDAHWIDPTSLDVFNRLVDRLPRMRALLVITFRPEFAAPWTGRGNVQSLQLNRFGRRQALAMIEKLIGGNGLPTEVLEQIVAKTDGVPLFVEELTKTVLESGLLRRENGAYVLTSSLAPLAIPSTLQDSLMARLDRLAPVKDIAQIGAAIGREFSYRLLEAVSPIKGSALQDALAQLVASELVHLRGVPPDTTYLFKHALVQDTAYATLLKSRRQQLHQRIAETIRDGFPDQADSEPGVIAHHFTQAELLEPAVEWWDKAGKRAMRRYANFEAAHSFGNGLALIDKMGEGERRDRLELAVRLAVGPALLATEGYASNAVASNYEAAERLSEKIGDQEAIFASTRGLWNFFYDRGQLDQSLLIAQRLIGFANRDGHLEHRMLALRALGSTWMSRAELPLSEGAFDECISLSPSVGLGACVGRHGEEPVVVATQYKSIMSCARGRADGALETARLAVRLAESITHPISIAFASHILIMVYHFRREYLACERLATQQMALCKEQGFAFWLAGFQVFHGNCVVHLKQDPAGVLESESGLINWIKTNAMLHVPSWSSVVADAAITSGNIQIAEQYVALGISTAIENGDNLFLPELHRQNARLLLMQGRSESARTALEEAIATAWQQDSKLFLLRSSRDLARLLYEAGDHTQARDLLSPIVQEFHEHRTGLDFIEANELLLHLR